MSTQYPVSTALVRYLPTISGYKVKKFKPKTGYEVKEVLKDEQGIPYLRNGINFQYTYDIELTPLVGYTTPVELTKMIFTAPTVSGAFPYPGTYSGTISILVDSEPEEAMDEAGHVALISFKGVTDANTP